MIFQKDLYVLLKVKKMINEDLEKKIENIRQLGREQFIMDQYSIHGFDHWEAVHDNGMLLGMQPGVDLIVVKLFSYLHDCKRIDDGYDEFHGERAAHFVEWLRSHAYLTFINEKQYTELYHACFYHNKAEVSNNLTIGACYDSDRLELIRCGTVPKPEFMSTFLGKMIAQKMQQTVSYG